MVNHDIEPTGTAIRLKMGIFRLMKYLHLILPFCVSLATQAQTAYLNQLTTLAAQQPSPQRDSVVVHYLFALSKNITPEQDIWIDSLRKFSLRQKHRTGYLLWQVIEAEKVIRTLNFKEGISRHLAFARALEKRNWSQYASWSYLRTGIIFGRPSSEFIRREDALLYYHKGLDLSVGAKDTTEIIRAYAYIGEYYLDVKDYTKAIRNLQKAEKLLVVNADKYLYPTVLASVGSCYLLLNNERMARQYYGLMNIWLTNGQLTLKPFYSNYIRNIEFLGFARYYQAKKQDANALRYAGQGYAAVQGFKQAGNTRTYDTYASDHLRILYEVSAKIGDFAAAFRYLKEFQDIQQAHLQSDLDRQFQELNKKYQTEQKEGQIVRLENEKVKAEADKQAAQQYLLLTLSALLAIGLGFAYWSNKELRQKNRSIIAAQLKGQTIERQRVAADLHDNLGSTLTALQWSLDTTDKSRLTVAERAVHATIREQVGQAYRDVRLLSHNLLPTELAKQGLGVALQHLVAKMNRNTAVCFRLTGAEMLPRLDEQTEFELYSICLELLNNTVKHAQATEGHIAFGLSAGIARAASSRPAAALQMTVSDNGKGVDNQATTGHGLQNVAARVASLSGTLQTDSGPETGVRYQITVPVTLAARASA